MARGRSHWRWAGWKLGRKNRSANKIVTLFKEACKLTDEVAKKSMKGNKIVWSLVGIENL
jgi:hypothetical protein